MGVGWDKAIKTRLVERLVSFMTDIKVHPQYPRALQLSSDSVFAEYAKNAAGCSGRVYLNYDNGELLLCDDADSVQWREVVVEGPYPITDTQTWWHP